jgi:hypothetical protein
MVNACVVHAVGVNRDGSFRASLGPDVVSLKVLAIATAA